MTCRRRWVALSCGLALALGGCTIRIPGKAKDKEQDEQAAQTQATSATATASASATVVALATPTTSATSAAAPPPTPGGGNGRATYTVKPPQNAELEPFVKIMQEPVFPALAQGIGNEFKLNRDLPITVKECGEANAWHDPKTQSITICYELAQVFAKAHAQKANVKPELMPIYVRNGMLFALLHEMGHAVTADLDLPVTGGEEAAVDDFATLYLWFAKLSGPAIDGAEAMQDLGKLAGGQPKFFGEHPFGEQRFYTILCMIYGSDPQNLSGLVTNGFLPRERAIRCRTEFEKKYKAWVRMLNPYLRVPVPETPPPEPPAGTPAVAPPPTTGNDD